MSARPGKILFRRGIVQAAASHHDAERDHGSRKVRAICCRNGYACRCNRIALGATMPSAARRDRREATRHRPGSSPRA